MQQSRRPRGPARRTLSKAFPGERAWLWHIQLKIERIISPLRIASIGITTVAWMTAPHPANAVPLLARAIVVIASVYALTDVLLVYRLPRLAERLRWGSTMIDFILVSAWIYATGGPNSAFITLAMIGAVSAPLRTPVRVAAIASVAYATSALVIAGMGHWFDATYILAAGIGLTAWTAVIHRDRRNGLRDDLTGCFSREFANFRLNDVYAKDAFPVALAVVDLDGFKAINDNFGHAAGDSVLVQAVRAISGAIRHGDLLARSGGDEFVLILPRTPEQTALSVAERVRRGVESMRFRPRRDLPPVRLSVSIGIALIQDAHESRADSFKRADDNLYAAKLGGRNRVIV